MPIKFELLFLRSITYPSKTRARIFSCLFISAIALTLLSPLRASDALELPAKPGDIERRGNWREVLEELSLLGIPRNWQFLGPFSNESVKVFEKQLEPEKTDDWNKPLTDNMGRVFKSENWTREKDDDGCYLDFYEAFANPPVSPVAFAGTEIISPVDGPALLWFEHAGKATVYFNNQLILGGPGREGHGVSGRKSKYEGPGLPLYPIPVELKRGRNFLKVKLLKERYQSLKGWGIFARIERTDLEWLQQLLAKQKEFYPEDAAGNEGAQLRISIGRAYERQGKLTEASAFYKEALATAHASTTILEDARDAVQRIDGKLAEPAGTSTAAWALFNARFKIAVDAGRAMEADREIRAFLLRFPFADEAGQALCYRGALRLDYAFDESARPFYERALREFSRGEVVRKLGVKGIEFADFIKPQNPQIDTNREAEITFAAIHRQLQNGNKSDRAAGLKALGELQLAQPGALIRAGGTELYPRYAGLNQVARELVGTLDADEKKTCLGLFSRPASIAYARASKERDAPALLEVAQRFPGASVSAGALNEAGNIYLDRAMHERAAQIFKSLRLNYSRNETVSDATIMAKEISALAGYGQTSAARELLESMSKNFAAERVRFRGQDLPVPEVANLLSHLIDNAPTAAQKSAKTTSVETFAENPTRTGASADGAAPLPGALNFMRAISPSECLNRARNNWPEDRLFTHLEPFPLVSNNRIFIATRDHVQAFDLADGREIWAKSWGNPGYVYSDRFAGFPQSAPSLSDGKLFARVVSPEKNAVLRCYSAMAGTLLWDTEKVAGIKLLNFSSEPLVAYNLVYAVFFEVQDHDTSRLGMAALDQQTGELVWKRYFGTGNSGIQIAERLKESRYTSVLYRITLQLGPPSARDGVIYTSTGLNSIAALDAYTGEIHWITAYPRLRAGNIYTGNSGLENCLPRLLKVLARGPVSPVVSENVVALAPRESTGIIGFDRSSGAVLWVNELANARFVPGICNDNLLVADDTVTALNLKTGLTAWEFYADGKKLSAHPGYSGGVLYLPYEDKLRRVEAASGKLLSSHAWDSRISGPLNAQMGNIVITDDRIIGVNAGNLISIGTAKN